MQALDDAHIPYGILTFGGETWQRMKLQATGLDDIPYIITHVKEKGRLLAGWKQTDRTFQLPEELAVNRISRADSLVLLDDKVISFIGIPSGVTGILVQPEDGRGGQSSALQEQVLPNGVFRVQGLKVAKNLIKIKNV